VTALTIGPLIPDRDLEDVVAIARESFSNPWTRTMFQRELDLGSVSRAYVARNRAGTLVAFCTCWLIVDELHINTVAVHPAHRGHGYARRILDHVFAEVIPLGARRATLEVRRSNVVAIGLYESMGFKTESVRRDYYRDPPDDALILWAELG
jgi:ribosomal-protein-alanine N-acetyltransferase